MSRVLDRRFLAALAVALVAVPAACSDEEAGTPTTTDPPTTASSTTSIPGPTAGAEVSELDGTAWLLPATAEERAGGGAVAAVVSFGADTLDAHDGVNTLAGEYEVDGSELTIRMGTPTDFPYPEDLAGAGLIERLATVDRATVDGDRLVLVQGDGTRVSLDPAPVGAAPSG